MNDPAPAPPMSPPDQRRLIMALALLTLVVVNSVLLQHGTLLNFQLTVLKMSIVLGETFLLALWFGLSRRRLAVRVLGLVLAGAVWGYLILTRLTEDRGFNVMNVWMLIALLAMSAVCLGIMRMTQGWTLLPQQEPIEHDDTLRPLQTSLSGIMILTVAVGVVVAAGRQLLLLKSTFAGPLDWIIQLLTLGAVAIGGCLLTALLLGPHRSKTQLVGTLAWIFLLPLASGFALGGNDVELIVMTALHLLLASATIFVGLCILHGAGYRLATAAPSQAR